MLIVHFKSIFANPFCSIGILGLSNLPLDETQLPHYKWPENGGFFEKYP